MADNQMDSLSSFDRVSIRAVLVREGEDPNAALAAAGIFDPIAIPVIIGEDVSQSGGILGDGITPNLKAVLETEQASPEGSSRDREPVPRRNAEESARPRETGTNMLPPAFSLQPLAPVRKIGLTDKVTNGARSLVHALNPISAAEAAELRGYATYYDLRGGTTASGQPFDPNGMNAAMTRDRAPLGTDVQVRLQSDSNRSIAVQTNDTGPFARGNDGRSLHPLRPDPDIVIDITPHAFEALTQNRKFPGKVPVIVTVPDHD